MKILLYNWAPFDDVENRGGGVRVYEANLVAHLVDETEHEVTVLSSGLEYDISDTRVRIQPSKNIYGDRVRSFTLVNSSILAPGHQSFGSPRLFDAGDMLAVWHQFLQQVGPFDVVLFDSLEGIPFTFLRVHEASPSTRVVVYAHNYYAVCPQVNLWKNEEIHCDDYHRGADCVSCVPHLSKPLEVERAHQLSRLLRTVHIHPNTAAYGAAYHLYARVKQRRRVFRALLALGLVAFGMLRPRGALGAASTLITGASAVNPRQQRFARILSAPAPAPVVHGSSLSPPAAYRRRRERAVELLNSEVDLVMATSNRSRRVLAGYGISSDKLRVSYIGTAAAESYESAERRKELLVEDQLTVAYLGYMRRDKGFFFLLDTLEACPPEIRAKLRLVVAARQYPPVMERLEALAATMVDIVYYDGYTHASLPEILEDVDVGVIPVQWEDNLPQVAIEMVSNGVPLITSHRGGAKELGGDNPLFVFTSSSSGGLIEIWRRLLEGELQPGDYWSTAMKPLTMHEHLEILMESFDQLLVEPEEDASPRVDAWPLPAPERA